MHVVRLACAQGWENFRKEFKQLRRSFRYNEYQEIREASPPTGFVSRVRQSRFLQHCLSSHWVREWFQAVKTALRVCDKVCLVPHQTPCSACSQIEHTLYRNIHLQLAG